jgi:hypothetical protein
MRGRCFADREAPRSADGQAGAARSRRRQADKVPAHQIGLARETSVNLQVNLRGNRGKRMAASDYKIPKGARVGLAKRLHLTATTFVLTKSIVRRIRGKTTISQAACFWIEPTRTDIRPRRA